jgi:hypothetical protein
VIWAHRRVVEVARELLRVVEELEEDAHDTEKGKEEQPACPLARERGAPGVWRGAGSVWYVYTRIPALQSPPICQCEENTEDKEIEVLADDFCFRIERLSPRPSTPRSRIGMR